MGVTTNTRSGKKAKDTGSVDAKKNDSLKENPERLVLDKDLQMKQEYLCARIDELRRKNDDLENRLRERERAEKGLRESEERFRILADDAPVLLWVNGLEGAEYVNRAYLDYLGVSGQIDILNYDWSQYVHPDDREGYLNMYLDCFMRREPFDAVFRFRRHDGVYRWMKTVGRPRFSTGGAFLGYVGSTQDITRQKSIEDELRRARDEMEIRVEERTAELQESEKRLKRSQEIAHLGSWELDLVNDTLSWSDEVYRIFGLQPQEFGATYEAFLEAVHPDDRDAVDAAYSGSICDGKDTYEIEHRVMRKSTGEVRIVHEKCEHYRDAAGKIIRSVGMVHDITERKRAEESLKFTQFSMDKFSDSAIWFSSDGRLVYVNETACKSLGFSKEELLAMHIWDIDRDYTLEKFSEIWSQLKRQDGFPSLKPSISPRDGRVFPVEVTTCYITYGDKEYLISFDRDITERKRISEALRVSEEKLRSYYELPLIGMALTSPEKGWIQANDKICEILGYSREELMQTSWDNITHPDDLDKDLENFHKLIAGEIESYTLEKRFIRKDGDIVDTEVSIGCVRNPDNSIRYIAGLMRDITKRKQAEELLQDAKNQAELYLDLMGHDISNMHQIMLIQLEMALEMMEEKGKLGIDDIEVIWTPLRTLERSVNLIKKVRKLGQVRSGNYSLVPVDLGPVLDEVVKEYSDSPGRDVTINYTPVCGQMVLANPLVKDVLNNLVDNAVRHTRDPVMIGIDVCRIEHKGLPFCQISIEDNGNGITDDRKDLIFQRLIGGQTKVRGTGLGLYMVKALVESFKGSIKVEDRVEGDHSRGARFVVSLPAVENDQVR